MAAEDEEHAAAAFDDEEDDLDDSEDGDDSDVEDDEEEATQAPPPAAPPTTADLKNVSVTIRPPIPVPNPIPPSDPASAPHNGAIRAVPASSAAPVTVSGGGETVGVDPHTPDVKRLRIEEKRPTPSASFDDSRRLFQRLWTDEDEIKILKGFLEFTSSRGTTFASHQYDTGPFYEQIKNELQLDFNKNQLIEKLRRLKKKYRNTANRMANHGKDFAFRSPHEKEMYDIAMKIWSAGIKRSRDSDDDLNPYGNNNASDAGMSSDRKTTSRSRRRSKKRALETLPPPPAVLALPPPPPVVTTVGPSEGVVKVEVQTATATTTPLTPATVLPRPANSAPAPANSAPVPAIPTVIEETVKSCLSPIFKELLSSTIPAPLGLGVHLPSLLNFGGNLGNLSSDEKWKQQQILELEVYLKRVELVRDHIKSTLEELKASQSQPASNN